jgi:hypothetical protein
MPWRFIGWCYDSQLFGIDGINAWDHKWQRASTESAEVIDPLYGKNFKFEIWNIDTGDKHIRFAAGEFSNCAWGFYQEQPDGVTQPSPT